MAKYKAADLEKDYTLVELQDQAHEAGLAKSGTKSDLAHALAKYYNSEETGPKGQSTGTAPDPETQGGSGASGVGDGGGQKHVPQGQATENSPTTSPGDGTAQPGIEDGISKNKAQSQLSGDIPASFGSGPEYEGKSVRLANPSTSFRDSVTGWIIKGNEVKELPSVISPEMRKRINAKGLILVD